MKKFQTTIGIALMMAMTAGIAGCNVTPAQTSLPTALTQSSETASVTTTEETTEATSETEETTEETTTEETTTEETTTEETTKKATPTPIPESDAKTTVKDQYKRGFKVNGKTLYTHIPQVIIEDVDTKAFNAEVLKKFQDIAKKNDSRVYYSYFVGKKAVSLYITIELESGNSQQKNFYVYNCSRTTGKKLSREEMLKIMGVSSSTFNSKVKNAIKNMWKKNYGKDTSAEKKTMEKNSLKTKMINSAIPYVNKNGKKAYLVRQIEVPGQMSHIDLHGTFS
ncbi:MAG: hypothetical protein IJ819_06500 [Clostridiales bacterium]|nr:hypothetical protein [Clostridiales bacterium]